MKVFKIKMASSGNCNCRNCGKLQEEQKMQPYTVWWKDETEKRGHQEPMCSVECCKQYIEKNTKGVQQ